mmetsp:Transcript_1546/g.4464  ORF Transcript_1546/g.4464 Transcript_1546/m.4464 type:complete len:197 (+) Transcript_1546:188-778(+)
MMDRLGLGVLRTARRWGSRWPGSCRCERTIASALEKTSSCGSGGDGATERGGGQANAKVETRNGGGSLRLGWESSVAGRTLDALSMSRAWSPLTQAKSYSGGAEEGERGYFPLRNSVAKTFNLKPIELPYPKMFKKRHKRMLQRLEFARLEVAIRKRNTREARARKMEKRREKWRAAVKRKEEWEAYLKSKEEQQV